MLTFTFDSADNMLTAANNAGAYTMAYDALSRMTSENEPFGLTLTSTYDAVDNRTLVQDSFGGVLTSVYDSLNRLSTREFGGTGQTPLRMDLTYTAQDYIATGNACRIRSHLLVENRPIPGFTELSAAASSA